MRHWEKAAAAYEAALARDDSRAEWHANLARMREKTQRWEEAAAAYEAALARDDSPAEWHAGLARMRALASTPSPVVKCLYYSEDRAIDLAALGEQALRIPSMGGHKIGTFLRRIARDAPLQTSIVEVGCWFGAGTAQLALGVLERVPHQRIPIHCFDRWIVDLTQVEKARQFANLEIVSGQDTLPLTIDYLRPFGVEMHFTKGNIKHANWQGGPISVYVDDASKVPKMFSHALKTFGPWWIPGVTIIVMMDYSYWQKSGRADHKCQQEFMERYGDHFSAISNIGSRGPAAFRYETPLVFSDVELR